MKDNNKLERFLRQQLHNYEAADNKWNVPPDDVWDNTLNEMAKRKEKPKNPFVWLWIFGLLVISYTAFYIYHKEKQLKNLTDELNSSQIALENIQKEFDDLKSQKYSNDDTQEGLLERTTTELKSPSGLNRNNPNNDEASLDQGELFSILKEVDSPISPDSQKHPPFVHSNTTNEANKKENTEILNSDNNTPIASSDTMITKSTSLEAEAIVTSNDNYSIVPISSSLPLAVHSNQRPVSLPRNSDSYTDLQPKRIWLKLHGAPLLINRQVRNSSLPDAGFANQGLSGFETGMHMGIDLNKKWAIETGMSYFNLDIVNERRKRFFFNSNNEVLNSDGLLESFVAAENINGLGSSDNELVFVRNSSDFIPNGTQITATVGSSSNINHLEIPLILNYKLIDRRFLINIRAGLVWNHVVNHNSKLNDVVVDNPMLVFNRGEIGPLNGIRQHTLSYELGFGVEYRFNKHWSLTLAPTYQNGITPHIEFNNGTQLILEKSGVFMGIKYKI